MIGSYWIASIFIEWKKLSTQAVTQQRRYQVFFLALYSMGLRLSEGLNLTVQDIDAHTMQIHVRNGKGGKDRLVPLPQRTLNALRAY
ncbi:Tyrosine recombinase XerC [Vibrio thalassae]|uniref:Tyrosine recombinase XerC n=1 Tax=Vibrio thalassae TaxID=1243014 RepID=A0A240EPN9_9VIBR|nr:Tyrosine recombinase XerC [Vibrio thalassae]